MRVLIVGCGYVGLPLGTELVRQGHDVFGVRRSDTGSVELTAAGIKPLVADIAKPSDLAGLPGPFDWVVNCVSSNKGGLEEYRQVYLQGTRNLIEWLAAAPPKKFVYTSSTSVYGQTDGSPVKESSPVEPAAETAKVLVEVEKLLLEAAQQRTVETAAKTPAPLTPALSHPMGEGAAFARLRRAEEASSVHDCTVPYRLPSKFPAVILRVAGIYGPDRGHWFLQYLKNEARIPGKGERFINMIHRDDLVGVIIAALKSGRPGEIYNAVDDEPVALIHFFRWLSETLGKWMPPFATEEEAAERKRGVTNKKVQNRRLKMELGYQFKYPNFRKGYTAEIQRLDQAGQLNIEMEPR